MKAALIDNDNNVINVIIWDDTCTAPDGTFAFAVEDDVSVGPGWSFDNGTFIPPELPPPPPPGPDYLAFWDALIASNVYASIRTQSMVSLPMNTLVTEFIALIVDAKMGRGSQAMIQSSISGILSIGSFTEEELEEFKMALVAGRLEDVYSLS